MFKKGRFKKVLVLSIVLVLALSTIAIAVNEVYQKKLTATIGRIKFRLFVNSWGGIFLNPAPLLFLPLFLCYD